MFDDQRLLRHAIVAIIEDGDDILFVERAETDSYPGFWSSVTGAMEPGENQQRAIVRECREEVGLSVKPVRKLWESVTRRAPFVLHWWKCELNGPREVTPDPTEVGDYKWMKFEDIASVRVMFSDARHFFRKVYPVTRYLD